MTKKDEKRMGVLHARAQTLKARMAGKEGTKAYVDAQQELLALEWAFERIKRSYTTPEGGKHG
jgi:hypothetical protein